jgi:hypothetical protein
MRTSGDVIAADRGNASSSFTTLAVLLPAPPTGDRAALDATGNLVLAIDATGLYPQFWQRTDRQSPWDLSMASTTPFDAIVQAVNQMGQQWSEPAFGASGDRLFYLVGELSSSKAGAAPLLYESQWDAQTSSWAAGVPLTNPELASADTTHRRRPTGASADDLTLFYYDEVNGVEGAAWRTDPSQPFSHFETIPAAPEAAPNLDCSALYFVGGGPLVPDGGTGGGGDGGMVIGPPGSDAGMTVGDAGTPWNGSGTGIYVAQ